MSVLGRTYAILRGTAQKIVRDNGPFLASGLAFNILLYCFPLTLLLVSALGYVLGESHQTLMQVERALSRLLPRSQRVVVDTLTVVVEHRGLLGGAGFATFVLFGTFLFGSIRHTLNTVFHVVTPRSLVRGIIVDLLVMTCAGALFVLVIGVASLLAIIRGFGEQVPLLEPLVGPGMVLAGHMLGFAFTTMLFYILYRFAPAQRPGGKSLLLGAVSAALLLQVAKWLFAWSVRSAQDQTVWYGAVGGLIFFIFWLYYASLVFILGATIAWSYEQTEAAEPLAAPSRP